MCWFAFADCLRFVFVLLVLLLDGMLFGFVTGGYVMFCFLMRVFVGFECGLGLEG